MEKKVKSPLIDNRAYLSPFKGKNIVLTGKLVFISVNDSIVILTFKDIRHKNTQECHNLNIKIKKKFFEKIKIKLLNFYEFKGKVFSYTSKKTIEGIDVYVKNYSLKKLIYFKLKK